MCELLYSKACMRCLGRIGFVVDCVIITGPLACLVRISMRRGILLYLPGYRSISKEDAFKTKLIRVSLVRCWEEGERCRHGAERWAAWLCCWCLHCEGRCYYSGLSSTSSDPQAQKGASLLHALLISAWEVCDWARSCPWLLSWTRSLNQNMFSLFLKTNSKDELKYSQRDFSCQKPRFKMILFCILFKPWKPDRICKVIFKDWLFAREGLLWAIALLPGV